MDANPRAHNPSGDFWSVWQAVERLFPARVSPAFLHGMTGGALRSLHAPLLLSDISCWLLPGLAACGVHAELLPLPQNKAELLPLLHPSLRCHTPVPVLAFATDDAGSDSFSSGTNSADASSLLPRRENEVVEEMETPAADEVLAEQALVIAWHTANDAVTIQQRDGTTQSLSLEEMSVSYSHGLRLERAPSRQPRSIYVRQAIRTWALFACAYPERVFGANVEDAPLRALAGEVWRSLVGKERSAPATRLRRLANDLETATSSHDITAALNQLYELACVSWNLPPIVEAALLAPPESVLTETERRELIYLCRAGNRDLRILAAHRLSCEREYPDARITLQQLRYDTDAWVRKAGSRQ